MRDHKRIGISGFGIPRLAMVVHRVRLDLAVVWLLVGAPAAQSQIDRLGTLGDSLTDEYAEEGYGSYSRSWTELLVQQRGVEMGPTAAGQSGGSWGEPRRSGYEDNWARFGATTDDALATGQHTGLAEGVSTRGVSHVVALIGTNDFSPWSGAYDEIYDGLWGPVEINAWVTSRVANLSSLVELPAAAGALLVLTSVFDASAMPFVSSGFPDPALRERVTATLADLAGRARDLAQDRRLTYFDMFGLGQAIFGTNAAPRATFWIGNVPVDLTIAGDAGTQDAGFVDDGIHPHTVIQGIFANCMLAALDAAQPTDLTRFSEEEILAHAGLSYGGSDTLAPQIGDCEDYVTDFSGQLFSDGFETGDTTAWSTTAP